MKWYNQASSVIDEEEDSELGDALTEYRNQTTDTEQSSAEQSNHQPYIQ